MSDHGDSCVVMLLINHPCFSGDNTRLTQGASDSDGEEENNHPFIEQFS
jgi:hypothetical protein